MLGQWFGGKGETEEDPELEVENELKIVGDEEDKDIEVVEVVVEEDFEDNTSDLNPSSIPTSDMGLCPNLGLEEDDEEEEDEGEDEKEMDGGEKEFIPYREPRGEWWGEIGGEYEGERDLEGEIDGETGVVLENGRSELLNEKEEGWREGRAKELK